jgi:hypothetical protein
MNAQEMRQTGPQSMTGRHAPLPSTPAVGYGTYVAVI